MLQCSDTIQSQNRALSLQQMYLLGNQWFTWVQNLKTEWYVYSLSVLLHEKCHYRRQFRVFTFHCTRNNFLYKTSAKTLIVINSKTNFLTETMFQLSRAADLPRKLEVWSKMKKVADTCSRVIDKKLYPLKHRASPHIFAMTGRHT